MPYPSPTLSYTTKTNKVDLVDAAHINLLQTELAQTQARLANAMTNNGTLLQGTSYVSPAVGIGQLFYRTDLGQVYVWSGTGWAAVSAISNIQIFTSSGTFTAPTGITNVYVTMVGGGGGGGGSSSGSGAGGGGGGGGSILLNRRYAVTPGNNYTVTVGTAGSAGAVNGDGGTGGTSVFDTLNAVGGGGGISGVGTQNGGTGGGSSTGFNASASISTVGTTGGGYVLSGGNGAKGNTTTASGAGGGTFFGTGAAGVSGTGVGVAGTSNTGVGGSGGCGSSQVGGAGGSGIVIVAY